MKAKKIPMRTCLGCRESKPKKELVRVVRTPEGTVKADLTGKAAGRGAYICRNTDCLKKSVRSNALSRALDAPVSDEVLAALEEELRDTDT